MSTAHRILTDLGKAYGSGGHARITAPSAGGTIPLGSMSGAYVILDSAGTYKVQNAGTNTKLTVFATAAVTLTDAADVHIVSLASGAHVELLADSDSSWTTAGGFATTGYVDLPLTSWREVVSNDIAALATAGTTGSGGVLATDTTPTLEFVNGDTDSQIRILWAAGNAHALARQITLPPDVDLTQDIVLHFRGEMADSNDAPVLDVDSFFNEGDTKVEDATGVWGPSPNDRTATIAAADIPSTAVTLSVEITPGTHATDTMALYASWLTYTRKAI